MKNIKYFSLLMILLIGLSSCGEDNYDGPDSTFRGKFIDKDTKEPYQTALGDTGVRIRMMEYSWSDTPLPYDFNCMMDGRFNNTKVFKGKYGIQPEGAFVPLEEELVDITGATEKTYEVEPLLRVEWIGEPVITASNQVEVKVKVTRGTQNPSYQESLAEVWLFISETNYVGDFSYSPNYSTQIKEGSIGALNTEWVITSARPFPSYARKFFIRFGARTKRQFSGVSRYNYSTIKEITTKNIEP